MGFTQFGNWAGLIPAHAGKTNVSAVRALAAAAHPRSRGENPGAVCQVLIMKGSSPLTRGKRVAYLVEVVPEGLIPAHAGKTAAPLARRRYTRAHPRSRGENGHRPHSGDQSNGSSPLTRGKPSSARRRGSRRGLIPAHAGKTPPRKPPLTSTWAHPRSRGENVHGGFRVVGGPGSSPLTRGKPKQAAAKKEPEGLIPAHAGKTPTARLSPPCSWAHPRSRGENLWGGVGSCYTLGSSPLTRGKRFHCSTVTVNPRLIPAHAGKTSLASLCNLVLRAHPRSRGENATTSVGSSTGLGSSPLTRGKRRPLRAYGPGHGLIPAHAGKTSAPGLRASDTGAHPRSRGENRASSRRNRLQLGSSPLTRGKP